MGSSAVARRSRRARLGDDDEAKTRSAFGGELEAIERGLAPGQSLTVHAGDDEVTLPPPEEYDATVSAPNRPGPPRSTRRRGGGGAPDLTWVCGRSGTDGES